MSPLDLVEFFKSEDIFLRTIGFGVINAASQHVFNKVNFQLDFTTDSLGLLNLNSNDHVGMVGFFPPLVKQIQDLKIPLVIIEKKEQLVKKTDQWEVTLDPSALKKCNKVLCTSTTVLNESIDDILRNCSHAEKISIIGPTAGFIPDPLFTRGVDVIGGAHVENPKLFMELIKNGKQWGASTKKYCINKELYTDYTDLLSD